MRCCLHTLRLNFYPRPPRGGRRSGLPGRSSSFHDFYPRPPRGGRLFSAEAGMSLCIFLSTPSARRATTRLICCRKCERYFYPRPPRGGRPRLALCAALCPLFLSTPSARRATFLIHLDFQRGSNFYPRPPRGGRRVSLEGQHPFFGISIHALREEGDPVRVPAIGRLVIYFYPRPPRGGRRCNGGTVETKCSISIHALREEGDTPTGVLFFTLFNFYPRPPRGGRLWPGRCGSAIGFISIHALREEGDIDAPGFGIYDVRFLSTPSARRATPLKGGEPHG